MNHPLLRTYDHFLETILKEVQQRPRVPIEKVIQDPILDSIVIQQDLAQYASEADVYRKKSRSTKRKDSKKVKK